ncbi:MAG TPA: MmgE/PrpD family protein [Trebonia sp.]
MTTTDEILARAAAAADAMAAAGQAGAGAAWWGTVTPAGLAAFRAAAVQGAGGATVRALLAVRPVALSGLPAAAWTAWLTTAGAMAAEVMAAEETSTAGDATEPADEQPAGAPRSVWSAVFGAAVALAGAPGTVHSEAAVTVAIAAGLDAAALVESRLAGWDGWSSGTVAVAIGAGVTAGLLLGLDEPRLRAAIGICATQAAGLRAAAGTDAFPLQVGKAAFNGVEAALLAQAGLTGPGEPLDGRRGLFALFG